MTVASQLRAAEPTVRALDIRGVRIGGATILTIDGDDLGKAPRLLLPFAAKQALKPGNTDKKAVFEIYTLKGDVEPGYHHLRVVTDDGVSLPVVIGVDALPQLALVPKVDAVPIALHGSVAGANVVETKFTGKAKQRVMIEVEAQRLGAKLRPIVHLYGPKKLQLDWAWGTPALQGDSRLEAVLPQDGVYTVTLHDAEYAAPAPSFFRLKIGSWSYVDRVFPPVVARAQVWTVQLLGSNGAPQVLLKAPKNADVVPLSWPKAADFSGPRPFVAVSSHAEHVEQPASDKLQEVPAGPYGISGKLEKPNEEDRYRVSVAAGKKVKLEVFAERIGSPLDVAVVVRDEKGTQLARGEDSPGTLDPVLEYTVPDKVTAIVVGVVDAQGKGGPRGIYRLVITPQSPGMSEAIPRGDGFKLTTPGQRISLPIGGIGILPVFVDRKGSTGAIRLLSDPALRGLSIRNADIPEHADGALLTFDRLDSGTEPIILNLRGSTEDGAEQTVFIKNHPLERLQPWLASEIALARTAEKASEFAIDWRDLPESTSIIPASRLQLPVKLTRPASKATVKLTLLTSQNTPLLNNQPDPNKAIRQDKLGELAANVTSGDVTLLAPPELSAPSYDVTVQAELLDPAKKVLATAYAPVRRMAVVLPIAVKLTQERIETTFDPKKGATLKIAGTVERREGLKADVAIALTGLPAGAKADAVTVKADAAEFSVNVTFPPTVPAGEIKSVKLSGSYAPDPKAPSVRVRSREVEVTLVFMRPP